MVPVIAATEASRRRSQTSAHGDCYACGDPSRGGLGLSFHTQPDGSVAASWHCPPRYQSYSGILHGGVAATLLDSAMVHALFARGILARTAELRVRYRHPIFVGKPVWIAAHEESSVGPLHRLSAEIIQDGVACASATAKFMQTEAIAGSQPASAP